MERTFWFSGWTISYCWIIFHRRFVSEYYRSAYVEINQLGEERGLDFKMLNAKRREKESLVPYYLKIIHYYHTNYSN